MELSLQSESQQGLYRVPDVDTSLHPETQQGLYRGQERGAILQSATPHVDDSFGADADLGTNFGDIYDASVFEISAATNESSFGAPTASSSPQVIQAGAGDHTETPQHFVDHIVDPIFLEVSDGSHRDPRPHKCTVPRCS